MLHQNVLLTSQITKLKEQLEVITKQKARKQKRIQHSGTMEYGEASAQVAAKASAVLQSSKKARSRSSQEKAQPALRRYPMRCWGVQ